MLMSLPAITAIRVASFSLAATRQIVDEFLDVFPVSDDESLEAQFIAQDVRSTDE